MFDMLIANGTIFDGLGGPGYSGAIAIKGSRIAEVFGSEGIAERVEAKAVLDACGLAVAPGFIDMHTHADLAVLRTPGLPEKISQGITSIIIGQCGLGFAPLSSDGIREMLALMKGIFGLPPYDPTWNSVAEFRSAVGKHGIALNVGSLVPHAAVRVDAMGFGARAATPDEIRGMRRACAQAIDEGAFGFSTGLTYAPCSASTTDELVDIAKVFRGRGFCAIHLRGSAGRDFCRPVREAIEIGRRSGASIHLNHFKPRFADAGRAVEMVELVDEARAEGLDISMEVYPYTAGSGALHQHLPVWLQSGTSAQVIQRLRAPDTRARLRKDMGGANVPAWGSMIISAVGTDKNRRLEGLSVERAAHGLQMDPVDFVCELLVDEDLFVSVVRTAGGPAQAERSEADIRTMLSHPACMVASDSIHLPGRPHPRTFGTFPRYLGRYVRDLDLVNLGEGIRKCTSLPAARLGLPDRGVIRKGAFADLAVFDPVHIVDRSRLGEIGTLSIGMRHVVVNGVLVLSDGARTRAMPGQWLAP